MNADRLTLETYCITSKLKYAVGSAGLDSNIKLYTAIDFHKETYFKIENEAGMP